MAFTNCLAPLATNTKAASCPEVEFIFARGSGQELNAKDYQAWKSSLERAINQSIPSLKYRFYELGTKKHGGVQYEAVGLNLKVGTSAVFSAGESYEFGHSVESGSIELKNYIRESSSSCRSTKFVLAGYSQGAMVISTTLPYLDSSKIIFAGTFGDPKLYLPEGKGIIPDACRGKNFSEYRYFAPNCRTHKGLLGALKPYRPSSQYLGKIGIWCDNNDPICGSGFKANDIMGTHTAYHTSGQYDVFADVVISKIPPPSTTKRDTVILLDTTNSMQDSLKKYRNRILTQVEAVAKNSRVALYTYGDLKEGIKPKRLLDFGASFSDFERAFANLNFTDGGDAPESALSAILAVMNTQKWGTNAIKSIVLITDAGFHNPDFDGTTLQNVIDRAHQIDTVNVYLVSADSYLNTYNDLLSGTSGKRLFLFNNLDLSIIYNRENSTSASRIAQPRAISEPTLLSLEPNKIELITPELPASVYDFLAERSGDTAKISFKTKNSPMAAILVDDALVSIVKTDSDNNITITDLRPNSIISIVPISESGFYGETVAETRDRGEEALVETTPPSLKLLAPNCGKQ